LGLARILPWLPHRDGLSYPVLAAPLADRFPQED
jgi:hypothetical protein